MQGGSSYKEANVVRELSLPQSPCARALPARPCRCGLRACLRTLCFCFCSPECCGWGCVVPCAVLPRGALTLVFYHMEPRIEQFSR